MPEATGLRLAAVVLAAGYSHRLGEDKALVRVQGRSLIERTLDLVARARPASLQVVIAPRTVRLRKAVQTRGARVITNRQRARGLSTSVRIALRSCRAASAVLLLPVDLVELTSRDLDRLIRRWRSAPRRLIARRLDSGAPGIPLILPRRLWPCADALRGDRGLSDLLAALGADERTLLDLPSADADVDTPLDLRCARRRARGRGHSRGVSTSR
jgi:molybdenum cofactor cytidylyltransferase